MTKNRDDRPLDELRFEYELLTNELYHLVQFTSLVDFDPLYRNSSESYSNFLSQKKLSVEAFINEDDIHESNASRRLKRRNNHQDMITSKEGAQWDILSSSVDERYTEMYSRLDNAEGTRRGGKRVQSSVEEYDEELERQVPKASKKRHTNGGAAAKNANKNKQTLAGKEIKHEAVNSSVKKQVKPVMEKKVIVKKEQGVEARGQQKSKPKAVTTTKHSKKTVENDVTTSVEDTEMQRYDDDEYYFTSSSDDEDPQIILKGKNRNKKPKIILHVHEPRQTITNNLHVVEPEFDNDVHAFLNSYKSLDEDISKEEYDAYIHERQNAVKMIRKGFARGAIRYDAQLEALRPIGLRDVTLPSNMVEPISAYYKEQSKHTFQDHLINQGVVMSKVFQDTRRSRIAKARRVSQLIESHFKHVAGAEERRLKEEERRRKNLARLAMQAVKKRWMMAEKAYKVLKKDEMDRLERIQGKQHLTEMLEQSTQLLGAQLNQIENDSEDPASYSDLDSSEDIDEDEMMSSSSSESDNGVDTEKKENDSNLSVEELRNKYAELNDSIEPLPRGSGSTLESVADDSVLNDNTDSGSDSLEDSATSSGEEEDSASIISQEETPGLSALLGNVDDNEDDADVHFSSEEFTDNDEHSESNDDQIQVKPKTESDDITASENDPLAVADVPIPSLLRGTLRIYQKQGLNWLASLYNNSTNGILADEMGLGKTIQTISLLAYLACEKENWGPHLIVVPTSVLLNWELEFKRFAPGFKVMTYYGSPQQRKEKRKGWNKPDAFHVCITSYQLVVHDQHSFKRKKWQYMILDEAHNIKNFRSTRWQALLNFNTERRLLLTGTPLQNNLAELWSLLYFLMPQTALENGKVSGFADLDAFQQWFGRPVDKIVETGENFQQDEETMRTVSKLHQVLRPYLLRRLKADVEKQMPAKYEHIIYCRLSKRQRYLYDDFMSRTQTKETLASGNFMSIINCLMQLRKVCNHPDLFEVRPILTSFCIENSVSTSFTELNNYIYHKLHQNEFENVVDLQNTNFQFTTNDLTISSHHSQKINNLQCVQTIVDEISRLRKFNEKETPASQFDFQDLDKYYSDAKYNKINELVEQLVHMKYLNGLRCERKPMYGSNLIRLLDIGPKQFLDCEFTTDCIKPLATRILEGKDSIEKFAAVTPAVVTLDIRETTLGLDDNNKQIEDPVKQLVISQMRQLKNPFHHLQTKLSIAFPDKSLLQYDCGKLQKLAQLLQDLKDNGHRALIFTQMTKVLDILEQFLNFHGYLYMRLDGATKIEDRQILTERFNSDSRITVFILSSRSGGLGINLTGADTVIFYDSDWNPAMDKQCQDRCHRIGQTRDVHIYRFVSEHTIESNILKKANQKRHLDNVVIQTGDFTTDYFTKLSVRDLLGSEAPADLNNDKPLLDDQKNLNKLLAQAEDEDDAKAAKTALREVNVDNEDFQEGSLVSQDENDDLEDEYEGTNHVEEYMIRYIANGFYY